MINDLHRKMCKHLFENYSVILLPEFKGSSNMYPRCTRVIGKKNVKTLLTWSHYKFRQMMIEKAKRYAHVQFHIVDESFTTVTCSSCGNVREKFHGEIFQCTSSEQCNFVCDRDVNASINILLKFMTERLDTNAVNQWLHQQQPRHLRLRRHEHRLRRLRPHQLQCRLRHRWPHRCPTP